jgi:hypothetical protein
MLKPVPALVACFLSLHAAGCDEGVAVDNAAASTATSGVSTNATSASSSASASTSGAGVASSSSSAGAGGNASSSSSSTSSTSGAGGSGVVCTDASTTMGTITARYGSQTLDAGGGKSYLLQSNWWHTFDAEAEAYSGLSFTVSNPTASAVPATDGAPMGFPSIFIGQYGGHTTTGSNLPKQVSALTSVPTIFKTNSSTIGLSGHNATYDVWFTQNNTPLTAMQSSPGMGGAYLMVWMFKPTDRQPRGTDVGHLGQTVAGVPGTWDVWIDKSTDPPCISYVSSQPIDGLEYDLNDFIQDSVTQQYGVTSSMYLSIVFAGFEIWGGNDGLQATQFCAAVN